MFREMSPLHILFVLSLATISFAQCTRSLHFFNPATGDDFLSFETRTNVSTSSLTAPFDIRAEFCSDGIQSVVFVICGVSQSRVANTKPYTSGPVSVGMLDNIENAAIDGEPQFVRAIAYDDFKGEGNVLESLRLDLVAPTKTPLIPVAATSTPSPSAIPDPSISLLSFSATAFNAPSTDPLVFEVSDGDFDTNLDDRTVLTVNQARIPNSAISLTQTRLTANTELGIGLNNITLDVPAADGGGLVTFATAIWVGTESLTVNLVQSDGTSFLVQTSVTAALADDTSVVAVADTTTGSVTFDNLPPRTILFEAVSESNDIGSAASISTEDSVSLEINGFSEPSTVDNNDFSSGLDGWAAPIPGVVSIIDHVENVGPELGPRSQGAAPTADQEDLDARSARQLTNMDLQLDTSGEGVQSVFRTFIPTFGTTAVRVRYRFITSEIPGGFFGSEFNDFFTVSIRSRVEGGNIMETASMNGLGLGAFNAVTGSTAWRETVLPLSEDFDTVEVRLSVANVGDGEFDSSVVVDFVEELGCDDGEPTEVIDAVGLLDAGLARGLAELSLFVAEGTGLPGGRNGPQDAFRHCHWSCRMTRVIGVDQARMVGDLHEVCGRNPEAERVMDLNNNAAGRVLGSGSGNCRALCLEGVTDGTLQTSLQ